MRIRARPTALLPSLVTSLLLAGLLAAPLPLLLSPAHAEPTPGVSWSLTRVVPEPWETNDFISLAEARGYLAAIEAAAPEHVAIIETGGSHGLANGLSGGVDTFQSFAVEVTHEDSAVPREEKKAVVFQLSIHGNEKGGREGGLRVIEDLALGLGAWADYEAMLDEVIVVFTFPNVDGWMHEEVPYRIDECATGPLPASAPCVDPMGYTRGNGRGQDLNRDWPSLGWVRTSGGRENALSEPEIQGQEAYLRQFMGRTVGATDIHGMLAPADGGRNTRNVIAPLDQVIPQGSSGQDGFCVPVEAAGEFCARQGHFTLGLLAAGENDARETLQIVRLSERAKTYLNDMAEDHFAYWTSLPNMGAVGGQWNEWGTSWDTIGYTDSGFTGDWFGQSLGAPGLDFELSYNHIVFDNHYIPEVNAWHVESTRAIVRAFLDEAREHMRPSLTLAGGGSVAWLGDPRVVAGSAATQEGPHVNATSDDAYEAAYEVSPHRFWRDLARYLPARSMVEVSAEDVAAGRFHGHATLVISGEAWAQVEGNEAALAHLRMHLDQGKRLVLTDGAMRALEALGLAEPGSVEEGFGYLGHIDLDRDHPMAAGVRGLARQTYDGVTVGFPLPGGEQENAAPIWTVAVDAVEGLDVAGTSLGADRASLGRVPAGEQGGEVVVLGALLPMPSQEAYHPYGLAAYAVSYTGYQLVYNALGIEVAAVPDDGAPQDVAPAQEQPPEGLGVPGPGVAATLLGGLGAAMALAGARRR